jgi:hypothetical protein
MRAIVIDPEARTVTEVSWSGKTEELFSLVRADGIDRASLPNGDDIWVDDTGLKSGHQRFGFKHQDYYHPLAGRAVIIGANAKGKTASCASDLAQTRSKVRFILLP